MFVALLGSAVGKCGVLRGSSLVVLVGSIGPTKKSL